MPLPVQPRCFHSTNKEGIAIFETSELKVILDVFSQDWGFESSLEPMDSISSCSNLSVMFLDSPDKILSLGRFKSDSADNVLSLGCPNIVSPDKLSCTGSKVPDYPHIVSSPDKQTELGSYSSLASVRCTFLVKLDFDLTLISSVAWTWVDVRCSVNAVLNNTSFGIEFTSWFTNDRRSGSTPRLRMVTGLFSVLSVTVNRCMTSIHSRSCLSTCLSSKSRSFPMTSGATFTVLSNRVMLFIPT